MATRRYFVVRPFGLKEGIDFDRIDRELIAPACKQAGFAGGTTGEFTYQGNIRTDMFRELLVADLVIADISIQNANVYYELGIRHGLRDKRTFLIKSEGDSVPFDLKTDRYMGYDSEDPAASVDQLARALRATRDSLNQDSPVFQLLPGLRASDAEALQVVPRDFQEEVGQDEVNNKKVRLQILAAETDGTAWGIPGLRLVAHEQRRIKDLEGARQSWEIIRELDDMDLQANIELGTIFEKQGDLSKSDQALERALEHPDGTSDQRAEIMALVGRNAKTHWEAEWKGEQDTEARQRTALGSGHLAESFEWYRKGFREDRNHFYSGLNALAMVTMLTELASRHPVCWEDAYESEDEAAVELRKLIERRSELAAGVKLSLESKQEELKRANKSDVWARISDADLVFLTSKKARRVGLAYKKALLTDLFASGSARKQLQLYRELGLLSENVEAALNNLPAPTVDQAEPGAQVVPRVLLFTGHRIDAPDRETARFPASKEKEARDMIQEAVEREKVLANGAPVIGISGGASGGDILFHEVCLELEIPSEMYLAIPSKEYLTASVQGAGPQWVERFNQLVQNLECKTLQNSTELPRWLRDKKGYGIWQRSNLWMLFHALEQARDREKGHSCLTLIALWNGKTGDGPGGTADMVKRAEAQGAKSVRLDTLKFTK